MLSVKCINSYTITIILGLLICLPFGHRAMASQVEGKALNHFLVSDAKLVVIYRDGQFISIAVNSLVTTNKTVDAVKLGKNVHIDKQLLKQIFSKVIK